MQNNNFSESPWAVSFSPEDTLEEKLKKAAHVKPSEAQLNWMEKEYIAFIHFGLNTFNSRQWGTGRGGSVDVSTFQTGSITMGKGMRRGRHENGIIHIKAS